MSKAGNWVPIDKGLVRTLTKLDRPYSEVEAMFSHTVDVDCGKPWTIKGYAKLWQWSRGKVRRFIENMRTQSGHIADRKGTQSGHPVHFIDKGLWDEADTKRTHSGHLADTKRYPTSNPNPNPNPKVKKKTVRFTPPSLSEIKEYCLERKNKIDPESFIDFYNSKGWMIGKNKMKCWKSSIRTWEKKENGPTKKSNRQGNGFAEARPAGQTDWLS